MDDGKCSPVCCVVWDRGLHGGPETRGRGTRTGSGLYFKWSAGSGSGPNLLLRVPGLFNIPESIGEHRTREWSVSVSMRVCNLQLVKLGWEKCEREIRWKKKNNTSYLSRQKQSAGGVNVVAYCKRTVIMDSFMSRGVTIRVSCIKRFTGSSKWKWSSLSPWSGDFGVNRARACRYLVVWNALGEGSNLISSLSSAGMFPWQRSMVSVSRCCCLNVKCLFIFVIITVANKHTFYILKSF